MRNWLLGFTWYRAVLVDVVEAIGTYLSPRCGDFLVYHSRMAVSMADEFVERRDWDSYRAVRDWLRRYESGRHDHAV